jgi:hypothetical protein
MVAVTSVRQLLVTASIVLSSPILVTVPPKRRLLQESHGVTSQNTSFFKYICLYRLNIMSDDKVIN